jgi:hypothetical protein
MALQWLEYEIDLPSSSTVEVEIADTGNLRCVLEVHNDRESLVLLSDALRKAVVEVDEQRALLADVEREGGAR